MDYSGNVGGKAHVGLADLVFRRENRSVKYVENGNFLILAEMVKWEDVAERTWQNAGWISVFLAGAMALLNTALLTISLSKRKGHHLKFECFVASLAVCNIVLSLGFVTYTFLLDVYYDVDSFDTLIHIDQQEGVHTFLWPIAKKVIHSVVVDNFAIARSMVMLQLGLDRYLSLFRGSYVPEVRTPLSFFAYCALPYFVSLIVLDHRILTTALRMRVGTADLARLLSWALPIVLGTVFTTISTCRPSNSLREGRINRICSRRSASTIHKQGGDHQPEPSHSLALLILFVVEIVQMLGFLPELVRENFLIELVVTTGSKSDALGSIDWNRLLNRFLLAYYQVAKFLFLASPLSMPFIMFTISQHYRKQVTPRVIARTIRSLISRKPKPHLDYRTETMRSIIAEQSRARQMRPASGTGPRPRR